MSVILLFSPLADAGSEQLRSCGRLWRRTLFAVGYWLLSLLLLTVSGCANPAKPLLAPGEPGMSIYLINHGWHTGIAMRRADIPQGVWPESGDFPEAQFLEVGWGDRDFYQTPEPGFWLKVKAGVGSAGSVLHVVGIPKHVTEYFSYNEIVEVKLPPQGAADLAQFISQAHRRNGAARVTALGKGLYGDSRFYPALGNFHVFNNCNTWTARALTAAGLPPPLFRIVLADGLMRYAGKFGTVVR